jgi:hypothetical protein
LASGATKSTRPVNSETLNGQTPALANARTAAEVLEARDMARMAYDAAKSFSRMEQAKRAHDTLIAEVYRAQANALAIEARAKMRLAEEYDAAQDRGEVRARGQNQESHPDLVDASVVGGMDALKEARQFRDAERADPGIIDRTISGMIERGGPCAASLRRGVIVRRGVPANDPKQDQGKRQPPDRGDKEGKHLIKGHGSIRFNTCLASKCMASANIMQITLAGTSRKVGAVLP